MNWTDDRCEELNNLQQLLTEVQAMDSGSGIVRRIVACEKLAAALNKTDFTNGRPSFLQFLNKLAITERSVGAVDVRAVNQQEKK